MAKISSPRSSPPFYWNPSGEDISRANNALSTRAGHNLAAGKFSNPRKTFGNSSAIVIPFIGIRAWKDQQKGGTLSLTEENGTDPSFSLPPSTLSLSLSHSLACSLALSHSLARPFSIKLTHIRSAGNESTRVFECIVEAYPEHLYERREDDTTGLSCELRFDSRSCTLSDADTGRWWREKRAERGENEKREREKEGRKEEERRENSSNGNHD